MVGVVVEVEDSSSTAALYKCCTAHMQSMAAQPGVATCSVFASMLDADLCAMLVPCRAGLVLVLLGVGVTLIVSTSQIGA